MIIEQLSISFIGFSEPMNIFTFSSIGSLSSSLNLAPFQALLSLTCAHRFIHEFATSENFRSAENAPSASELWRNIDCQRPAKAGSAASWILWLSSLILLEQMGDGCFAIFRPFCSRPVRPKSL